MKHALKSIRAAWILGGLILVCPFAHSIAEKRKPAPGHWRIVETFENDSGKTPLTWSFELVEDGSSTNIAVGNRLLANGKSSQDRSVSILFFDLHDDGSLSGSIIEARGDGSQREFSLDVDLEADRKKVAMAAFDREGSITSKFKGEWLGKGAPPHFKPGNGRSGKSLLPARAVGIFCGIVNLRKVGAKSRGKVTRPWSTSGKPTLARQKPVASLPWSGSRVPGDPTSNIPSSAKGLKPIPKVVKAAPATRGGFHHPERPSF